MRELAAGSDEHHVKDHKAVGIEPAKPVLVLDPRHQQALETARLELATDPRLSLQELALREVDVRLIGHGGRSCQVIFPRAVARAALLTVGAFVPTLMLARLAAHRGGPARDGCGERQSDVC